MSFGLNIKEGRQALPSPKRRDSSSQTNKNVSNLLRNTGIQDTSDNVETGIELALGNLGISAVSKNKDFSDTSVSRYSLALFELAEEKLKNKQPDLALLDLEKLINRYPNDSLASKALYKMFTIHLHWHHNPSSGYDVLEKLVKHFPNSKQGIQAKVDIEEYPETILNKTESLRNKDMTKEEWVLLNRRVV